MNEQKEITQAEAVRICCQIRERFIRQSELARVVAEADKLRAERLNRVSVVRGLHLGVRDIV